MFRSIDTVKHNKYIDVLIAFLFLLSFFFLYASSLDFDAPGMLNHNVIFDIDPDRVVNDMAGSEKIIEVHKHPLYGLFFRTIMPPIIELCEIAGTIFKHYDTYSFELIEKLVHHPPETVAVTFLICFAGACSVGISFLIFNRFLHNRSSAILFTLLVGVSPPVWVLSSVPETFSLNLLCLVCAFYFQAALPCKTFLQRNIGHILFFLLGFVATGITLPNGIYVAICYFFYLKRHHFATRQLVGIALLYSFGLYGTIAIASFLQSNIYPVSFSHILPQDYISIFIREDKWNHNIHFEKAFWMSCMQLGRSFFIETIVAPKVIFQLYHYPESSWRILAFSYKGSAIFALASVGYCVALAACVLAIVKKRVLLSGELIIAMAIIVFNCLFHTVMHGLGIPFIYSIHVVLPLLYCLAAAYNVMDFRYKKVFLVVFVCTIIINNSLFLNRINVIIKNDDPAMLGRVEKSLLVEE
jgi:Family of unknown function (DUF6080)